ncbi:MAG: hypothetical protein F6K11_07155 [Leptolyngbya sp. SIO3F4]|nr:hypothetical protein [Leptolyngbya sp. SIO3F4]
MGKLSTIDRFLGSLLGGYIGYHRAAPNQSALPSITNSTLYQSWLVCMQNMQSPGLRLFNCDEIGMLPWLLYHHDNRKIRHDYLQQALKRNTATESNMNIQNTLESLYLLGDILEFIMQYSPNRSHTDSLLYQELRQQTTEYPTAITPQVTQWLTWLSTPSSVTLNQSPTSNQYLESIFLGLWQCLRYHENLALALSTQTLSQNTYAITGYLLGAWKGISVIPNFWQLSIPPSSRRTFTHIAKQIYCSWAGISFMADTLETLPLDL